MHVAPTISLFFGLFLGCSSYNILVFLPLRIWSHYQQIEPLFFALAEKGHNLTVYSKFPPKNPLQNFTHIFLTAESTSGLDSNPVEDSLKWQSPFEPHSSIRLMGGYIAEEIFQSPVFHDLTTNPGNEFDLVFTELFFGQEFLCVLGHIFKAPVVTYSSFGYSPVILQFTGGFNAFSYVPDKLQAYADLQSFFVRQKNALVFIVEVISSQLWFSNELDKILAANIPGPLPSLDSMLRNVSLFFLTSHSVLDSVRSAPPNLIEIPGMHIKPPPELPADLQRIMDEAVAGVIFFSYGSIIKTSHFKKKDIEVFINVLGKLDQTILWKSDINTSDWTLPKNIIIRDWYPQTSVLAHPKCELFLTHGGISSMMEAVYNSVPVVGMPFYGDQGHNLAYAKKNGYGLFINYDNFTAESFTWAVHEVLSNPKYKDNVKRGSQIFRDRPMESTDTGVYWTEYVIRHKGAHHLKSDSVFMPWYQLLLLDTIFFFVTITVVLVYFVVKVCTFFYKTFLKRSNVLIKFKQK